MNLHGLRLFYIVAEAGSVTAAAEQLRISQPAITLQIKKFERENNIKLFIPEGRGICLTDIGEQLFKEAKVIFNVETRIESMIDNYLNGKNRTLRIAGNYLASNYLIPKWAAELKKRDEDINIEINTMNTQTAIDKLMSYEADAAIIGSSAVKYTDKINISRIIEDELWFVVSPDNKFAGKSVKLEEIVSEPFIMREKGSHARVLLESICYAKGIRAPKISLEFNGLHETLMASMYGYGVNFCSSIAAGELVEMNRLVRVFVNDVKIKNEIYMCIRKDEELQPIIKEFISLNNLDFYHTHH
ncbi:MAG: LysR family transcriptional regulator [Clostridium sp.]|nr:LysR family transcriptional regulator [Clostridium sp.]